MKKEEEAEIEKIIDKQLLDLGYDIEGCKTSDFVDGWVRGYEYRRDYNEVLKNALFELNNEIGNYDIGLHYPEREIEFNKIISKAWLALNPDLK